MLTTPFYIVNPQGPCPDVYAWRHASLEEAEKVAIDLCKKHHCEVIVSKAVVVFRKKLEREEVAQ